MVARKLLLTGNKAMTMLLLLGMTVMSKKTLVLENVAYYTRLLDFRKCTGLSKLHSQMISTTCPSLNVRNLAPWEDPCRTMTSLDKQLGPAAIVQTP